MSVTNDTKDTLNVAERKNNVVADEAAAKNEKPEGEEQSASASVKEDDPEQDSPLEFGPETALLW
jgi:hypothetical protein